MPVITKPVDINKIWAATGDVLTPSDTKISQGWQVEIPPRQTFNYIDGKQDQAIAHINQHGIAVWDTQTEYQANQSYSKGSDGIIYKALTTNTNINPVGDVSGAWQVAFSTPANTAQVATATQSRAQTANNVYISPLQLANAFTGTNQNLNSESGFQKLPGGMIVQWVSFPLNTVTTTGQKLSVVWPTQFVNSIINCFYTPDTNTNQNFQLSVVNRSKTGADVYCNSYPSSGWASTGSNIVFAVGF